MDCILIKDSQQLFGIFTVSTSVDTAQRNYPSASSAWDLRQSWPFVHAITGILVFVWGSFSSFPFFPPFLFAGSKKEAEGIINKPAFRILQEKPM